jgi:ribonucleotide monophosphatase NagD (HAD superfamily)
MGKPAPIIYREAARLLGLQPGELLAVGDSLEHDVAGAQAIGADTLFVLGGIHAADVRLDAAAGTWDGERLRQLAGSYGVSPTYAVPFMAV